MMGTVAADTTLGSAIRDARERRGWTQAQLAGALGKDPKTVRNWESGRTAMPRGIIAAIEDVLGISLRGDGEMTEDDYERSMQEFLRLGQRLFGNEADRGGRHRAREDAGDIGWGAEPGDRSA